MQRPKNMARAFWKQLATEETSLFTKSQSRMDAPLVLSAASSHKGIQSLGTGSLPRPIGTIRDHYGLSEDLVKTTLGPIVPYWCAQAPLGSLFWNMEANQLFLIVAMACCTPSPRDSRSYLAAQGTSVGCITVTISQSQGP